MIKAEIVAHSLSPQGEELISVLATFPRIILAEVNTHRMLSKNTSSSRAIPFLKMVETIKTNPFIPIAWQKAHSGMQGSEYFTDKIDIAANTANWLEGRDRAVATAFWLTESGVTKQLTNRLLEPFMWTTMLITGSKSGWDNFFRLRCPSYAPFEKDSPRGKLSFKSIRDINLYLQEENPEVSFVPDTLARLNMNTGQAEIHIMDLAEKIWDAKNESTPKQLKAEEWHIPFEDKMPKLKVAYTDDGLDYKEEVIVEDMIKMSVAMGARTSYTTVGEEKEINPHTLVGLHDRLLTQEPPHSSPFEHCQRAMSSFEYISYYRGKLLDPEIQDGTDGNLDCLVGMEESSMGWCYNSKGFIPYRYLVDNSLTI